MHLDQPLLGDRSLCRYVLLTSGYGHPMSTGVGAQGRFAASEAAASAAATKWSSDVLVFAPTMRPYHARWLRRDLLAGVTFGAITIPGQLATAHLAGMPPITGLYGFFAACVVGALISSNRHLALGVDSTVAPILATGLATFAAVDGTKYIGYATATTLLVGLLILTVGLAQLGWVGDMLPKPVITGFLAGIAITITINQLPGLFGVPAASGMDLVRLWRTVDQIPDARVETTLIGLVSLLALLVLPRLLPKFPVALLVLVVATGVSTVLNLPASGVAVLGELPKGLPPIAMPPLTLDTARIVLPTAIGITVIALAQTAATSRTVAATGGFEADVARDFRALGTANIASSLMGSFAIDASPPSSTILSESRARSQVAALTAALLTAVLILLAAGLIADLPMSVLSAILIYIASKIFRVDQMASMRRYSARSFWLMAGTAAAVVLLGIEIGLALAVLVSFLYRAKLMARPELLPLGRTPDGAWLPEQDDRSETPAGVAAYLLNGPLWFGNANWFRQQLIEALGDDTPESPDLLVLDATRIDDIDYTGVDALIALREVCVARSVTFAIACHIGRTEDALRRGGWERGKTGQRIYDSVESAVQALHSQSLPPTQTQP